MREFKSFYKTVGGNEGNLCHCPTRLDTYGTGCGHNCSYCYARSLLEFRGMWHPQDPAVADLNKIRRKLNNVSRETILRLGGMTDCFQPCEREQGVTYETIKMLNERGIGYLIVTKSALVADDKYIDVMDKDLAHIQITLTATDDKFLSGVEYASPVADRIAAIEKLQANGFDVSIRLSPYVPEWVDTDVINSIKCDKLLVEFLRSNGFIRKTFDIDYSDYTLTHKGYRHLPLDKKVKLLSPFVGHFQITVCDDVPDHYEYFKYNFNVNPNDCCNLRR